MTEDKAQVPQHKSESATYDFGDYALVHTNLFHGRTAPENEKTLYCC